MTQSLKEDEKKHKTNNEKIAKSRIKLGLILTNMEKEIILKYLILRLEKKFKNKLKVLVKKNDSDYYQKNPNASQNLKSSIYEEKIINLIKSKIKLETKNINTQESEDNI